MTDVASQHSLSSHFAPTGFCPTESQESIRMKQTITAPRATLDEISTQPVDRRWVHRAAVGEVFLTDFATTGANSFVACCQLPRRHHYFSDHCADRLDPMLLLECCRQAETCCAHLAFEVPIDHKFILNHWDLDVVAPSVGDGRCPRELRITITAECIRDRGAARGYAYSMALEVDDFLVGTVRMTATYLSPDSYAALRRMRRIGDPPTSDRLDFTPMRPPVGVGRRDPNNIMIHNLAPHRDGGMQATLSAAVNHPSIFDHSLDHVPGLGVTEAAKQLALATTGGSSVNGLTAEFRRFLELDEPATMIARRVSAEGLVEIEVVQCESSAAVFEVEVEHEPATPFAKAFGARTAADPERVRS
ncbi:ScbA/BarX family gamma-butyrolactone biosynthesis protein [Williamsia sp.]|uniref:ScbA/BarX family gamma-butyrolactone biosynthesis protein n=1 Tax=Williamsia sp. TaxID=1872085 RepID=UPI001A322F33|nr:ScbA/BarX family gamma-butyrolactone biosynthesis protein [Williamsia sp.]MBJ7289692.1 hypothetical protein [Williamsia sp.]